MKVLHSSIVIGFILFLYSCMNNDNKSGGMYGIESDTTNEKNTKENSTMKGAEKIVDSPFQYIKQYCISIPLYWFDGNPDYIVKDDDFIQKAIDDVLKKYALDELPKTESGLKDIEASIGARYYNMLTEKEGLQRIEKLLQKRYENPIIKLDTISTYMQTLTVDYGCFPGTLSYAVRGGRYISASPHFEEKEFNAWKSADIAMELNKWKLQYPNIAVYILKIHRPTSWYYTYTYTPAQSQLDYIHYPTKDGEIGSGIGRNKRYPKRFRMDSNLDIYISGRASLYEAPQIINQ